MRSALITLLLLIQQARADTPFRTGILPILTKAGCNSGACHGAATGQGGFKLSLLGYDPDEDFLRITRERAGRRIDLDQPADSLLLRKSARQLDHEGGRRLPLGSEDYNIVRDWIASGARPGPGELAVASLDLEPAEILLNHPASEVQLRATATLTDGTRQDVRRLALYSSNNDAVAAVSPTGVVSSRGKGIASIMVRYAGQVAAARVAIPFGPPQPPGSYTQYNAIDGRIHRELARLGLNASPVCPDWVFLRRASLDLTGRLPSPESAREFSRDPATPERRARLVESLLASDAFVDYWTLQFAELLLIGGKVGNQTATRQYHQWLRDQISQNTPLNQLVRALLVAEGDITRNGPANFYTLHSDPRDFAEHVGRTFLGTRLACARCHAHPADRWTQTDYHRFAAYFARIALEGDRVVRSTRGEVNHPKTGLPLAPQPLGMPSADRQVSQTTIIDSFDRRQHLADWLTSPENPFFARSFVNRVWKLMLGRGLVEPVDDLRPTNPASHPALLDDLARDFIGSGFDLRYLLRTIASSATYQLSSIPTPANRADDHLFSHACLKPLSAQVQFDAMAQAAGVTPRFDRQPDGLRAVQLVDTQTPSYTLDVLGRCSRDRACDPAAPSGGGLSRALHLIHGNTIHDLLSQGIVNQFISDHTPDDAAVTELYLRTLSRPPSGPEMQEWRQWITRSQDRREGLQDLLWALLNCREFTFNH